MAVKYVDHALSNSSNVWIRISPQEARYRCRHDETKGRKNNINGEKIHSACPVTSMISSPSSSCGTNAGSRNQHEIGWCTSGCQRSQIWWMEKMTAGNAPTNSTKLNRRMTRKDQNQGHARRRRPRRLLGSLASGRIKGLAPEIAESIFRFK